MLYPNGTSYNGDFVKGVKHGKGTYKWPDGTIYNGAFKDGK